MELCKEPMIFISWLSCRNRITAVPGAKQKRRCFVVMSKQLYLLLPRTTFEQYEPWTGPQLNIRWTWVCFAVILWNSSLWMNPSFSVVVRQPPLSIRDLGPSLVFWGRPPNNHSLALCEYQLIEAGELRGMRAWNKTLYVAVGQGNFLTRGWIFSPFYADVFNLRSFDLRPGLGLPPSIQPHSPLSTATQIIDLLLVRRKFPLTHWLSREIHVIGTESRA